MQVAFYFAGEIIQVLDAIPWVRCASGNVFIKAQSQSFPASKLSLGVCPTARPTSYQLLLKTEERGSSLTAQRVRSLTRNTITRSYIWNYESQSQS